MSPKNLSSLMDFSKTHRQTQRINSWIGVGLRKDKKLVPSQTNTRILSYDLLHARGKPSTMFTARGTRRAFPCSMLAYALIKRSFYGMRLLKYRITCRSAENTPKLFHNLEKFVIYISPFRNPRGTLKHSNTLQNTTYAS